MLSVMNASSRLLGIMEINGEAIDPLTTRPKGQAKKKPFGQSILYLREN